MRAVIQERFKKFAFPVSCGCWVWLGITKNEYGRFRVGEKMALSHRVSYEVHIGAIPEGLLVLHKCDNPECVNPAHLFLGTHKDNTQDAISKGRMKTPGTKLTATEAKAIRADPRSNGLIAHDYSISQGMVSSIKHGRYWVHV